MRSGTNETCFTPFAGFDGSVVGRQNRRSCLPDVKSVINFAKTDVISVKIKLILPVIAGVLPRRGTF
jgi:hypothetical protein